MVGEILSPLRFTILCGLMGVLGAYSLQSQSLSSQSLQLTVEAGQDLEGFVGVAAEDCGVDFRNDLDPLKGAGNRVLFNGSGLALGDLNDDGLPEVFFCAIDGENALFTNRDSWQFQSCALPPSLRNPGVPSRGAVFADVDGDRDLDILLATVGRGVLVFLNRGSFRFEDASAKAGLETRFSASGLTLADVDGNGSLDVYVANNRVDDIRDKARVPVRRVGNQILPPKQWEDRLFIHQSQLHEYGEADRLYLNNGLGQFTPVSWTEGAFRSDGKPLKAPPQDWGLSAMLCDWTGDGWPDLYVCNDYWTPDRLWVGDGQGGFDALDAAALKITSASSMGVDMADVDQDGDLDLFVADMLDRDPMRRKAQLPAVNWVANLPHLNGPWTQVNRNTLLVQESGGRFVEMAQMASVQASGWSWCPIFMDVDLDGLDDLLVSAGYSHDMQDLDTLEKIKGLQHPWQGYPNEASLQAAFTQEMQEHIALYPPLREPVAAFRNLGKGQFEDVTDRWGTQHPAVHQGFATADLDADGDLDLVLNRFNDTPAFYRNQASGARLSLSLMGKGPNTAAVGARMWLDVEGLPSMQRTVIAGGRYLSHGESKQVFAMPSAQAIASLRIRWPDGSQSVHDSLMAQQHHLIQQPAIPELPAGGVSEPSSAPDPQPWFVDASHWLNHVSKPSQANDFAMQPSLPFSQAHGGTGLSSVDINRDGRSDIILGAVKGERITVFESTDIDGEPGFERRELSYKLVNNSTGLLAMGLPGGAVHLLMGQDGYQTLGASSLVEFDLKGRWRTLFSKELPGIHSLVAGPAQGMGHLGVAAMGYTRWGLYPHCHPSLIFEQEASKPNSWQIAPDLSEALLSVVRPRSALWCDLRGDGYPELLIASHGGPIRLFENRKGHLEEATAQWGLDRWRGLWTSLVAADLDGNGHLDLLAGNLGANTRWHASREKPLRWYFGDPLKNGRYVVIETVYHADGRQGPALPRDKMVSWMPSMRSELMTHESYKKMSIEALLEPDPEGWSVMEVDTLESMILYNNGEGKFDGEPLPLPVQQAPISGVQAADFNGDGQVDLIVGQIGMISSVGNFSFQLGGLLLLRGESDGTFRKMSPDSCGLPFDAGFQSIGLGDFNGDHRMDIVATQAGSQTRLFFNQHPQAAGLSVRIQGKGNNPFGVGCQLRMLDDAGGVLFARTMPGGGSGWQTQNDPLLILPMISADVEYQILWPGGEWRSHHIGEGVDSVTIIE